MTTLEDFIEDLKSILIARTYSEISATEKAKIPKIIEQGLLYLSGKIILANGIVSEYSGKDITYNPVEGIFILNPNAREEARMLPVSGNSKIALAYFVASKLEPSYEKKLISHMWAFLRAESISQIAGITMGIGEEQQGDGIFS